LAQFGGNESIIQADKRLESSNNKDSTLGRKLQDVYEEVLSRSEKARTKYSVIKKENEASRDNLLAYLALRELDISKLQLSLANEGLSSLGRLEGQVLRSMEEVLGWLGIPSKVTTLVEPSFETASSLLEERSKLLLGRPREGKRTRIMITLDPATIYEPELLEQLLLSGMDIARINCAHDTQREWLMLINAIRTAEERLIQKSKGNWAYL